MTNNIQWAFKMLQGGRKVARVGWHAKFKLCNQDGARPLIVMQDGRSYTWRPTYRDVLTSDWGLAE